MGELPAVRGRGAATAHTSIRPQLPDTSLRVLEGFEGL